MPPSALDSPGPGRRMYEQHVRRAVRRVLRQHPVALALRAASMRGGADGRPARPVDDHLRNAMAAVDPPGERCRAGGDPLVNHAGPRATREWPGGLVAAQVARVGEDVGPRRAPAVSDAGVDVDRVVREADCRRATERDDEVRRLVARGDRDAARDPGARHDAGAHRAAEAADAGVHAAGDGVLLARGSTQPLMSPAMLAAPYRSMLAARSKEKSPQPLISTDPVPT